MTRPLSRFIFSVVTFRHRFNSHMIWGLFLLLLVLNNCFSLGVPFTDGNEFRRYTRGGNVWQYRDAHHRLRASEYRSVHSHRPEFWMG